MTTWDDYLLDVENETGTTAEDIADDLHDREQQLADAEMDAILAGDVEAAEALHAQWQATEEAADHADWAEQDLEWAQQSQAEAEADLTDAAEAATMDLPESADRIAGMAGIAEAAAQDAVDEAVDEYGQSIAFLEEADAVDEVTSADEPYVPYDADPDDSYSPYDADPDDW